MPVIDDAPASSQQATGRGSKRSQPAAGAEGTGLGEGTAADVKETAAGSDEQDSANEDPATKLARLRIESQRMKGAKKKLMQDLRNARRCHQRLKSKAKKLSDNDLLHILAMRNGVASGTKTNSSSSSAVAAFGVVVELRRTLSVRMPLLVSVFARRHMLAA